MKTALTTLVAALAATVVATVSATTSVTILAGLGLVAVIGFAPLHVALERR